MSEFDLWVIEVSQSPRHDLRFAGIRNTKDEAIEYAAQIAKSLYPDQVIIPTPLIGTLEYKHPNSAAGDVYFIRVFLYDQHRLDREVLRYFKVLSELPKPPSPPR